MIPRVLNGHAGSPGRRLIPRLAAAVSLLPTAVVSQSKYTYCLVGMLVRANHPRVQK